jgi:hypothetical protein
LAGTTVKLVAAGAPPPPPQATKTAADKPSKAAPKSLRFMEIPLNSVEKIEKTPKSAKAHICRTNSNDTRKQALRKEIVISAGVVAVLLHICNFQRLASMPNPQPDLG